MVIFTAVGNHNSQASHWQAVFFAAYRGWFASQFTLIFPAIHDMLQTAKEPFEKTGLAVNDIPGNEIIH